MMSSKSPKDVGLIYEQICKEHDAIADFRAKLLALLPIASGAGIFLLFSEKGSDQTRLPYLLPVGIFGALVTFGLFCFALRGVILCVELIASGKKLDQVLAGRLQDAGRFRTRRDTYSPFSVPGATLIIYSAVIGAWFFVATVGLLAIIYPKGHTHHNSRITWSLVVFFVSFAVFWFIGQKGLGKPSYIQTGIMSIRRKLSGNPQKKDPANPKEEH